MAETTDDHHPPLDSEYVVIVMLLVIVLGVFHRCSLYKLDVREVAAKERDRINTRLEGEVQRAHLTYCLRRFTQDAQDS